MLIFMYLKSIYLILSFFSLWNESKLIASGSWHPLLLGKEKQKRQSNYLDNYFKNLIKGRNV